MHSDFTIEREILKPRLNILFPSLLGDQLVVRTIQQDCRIGGVKLVVSKALVRSSRHSLGIANTF